MSDRILTIEEIAPFFAYGLRYYNPESGYSFPVIRIASDFVELYDDECGIEKVMFKEKSHIKPLFLPLSELPKQFPKSVSGNRYIDEINNKSSYSITEYRIKGRLGNKKIVEKDSYSFEFSDLPEAMPIADVYDTYIQIFKHQFDFFGLIEAGLAYNQFICIKP